MTSSQKKQLIFVGIVFLLILWIVLVLISRQLSEEIVESPAVTPSQQAVELPSKASSIPSLETIGPSSAIERSETPQDLQKQSANQPDQEPIYEPPLQNFILVQ
ncbi:MAG: hypothetical protein NUV91_00010 [Candidatus Omnitrophica bacterium]|nr:hypothetical protein [Candidatus Omnitrophota bacterium]